MTVTYSLGNTSWIATLADAGVKADVAAMTADGSFSYADLVKLLDDVANAGAVTSAEFSALRTVAANLNNGVQTSDYLTSAFQSLVDGNALNAYWTAGTATSTALGNLAVGTGAAQLKELIGKWLLGTDNPNPTDNGSTPSYQTFNAPLFAAGGPSTADVVQGNVGDCEVLTTLNEIVTNDPNAIRSMIVSDGGGVYGVRFYLNGDATWVTVNNQFPIYSWGGLLYDGNGATSPSDFWVQLVEKAFAVFSSELPGYGATNSYFNINGNAANAVLEAMTPSDSVKYYYYSDPNWTSDKAMIAADVESGDDVTLESYGGTTNAAGQTLLVADHAFAVVGYDAATGDFIVRNPWGPSASVVAQFEVSMSDVAGVQGDFAVSDSALYSSPVRVYAAPRELLSGVAVSVASLFTSADASGAPISQYKFENIGAGTLSLNGATNLASAAETAQGQIVVSAADLAKLTYSAANGTQNLLVSAYDGKRWSAAVDLSLTVASSGDAVVASPKTIVAPNAGVSLASLFHVAGTQGSSSASYAVDLNGSNLTVNLNGATSWGTASAGQYDFYASDLSKIALSAGTGAGPASFSVAYYNGSSWSDWTTVALDIGASVGAAIGAFDNGLYSTIGAIADSAANIFANLNALQTIFASGHLDGLEATNSTSVTETLTAPQFFADLGVLSVLRGAVTLNAAGLTVSQALNFDAALTLPYTLRVADSAANVAAGLVAMGAEASVKSIWIQGVGAPVLDLTAAEAADAAAIGKIANQIFGMNVGGAMTYVAGGNGFNGPDLTLAASNDTIRLIGNSKLDVTGTGDIAILAGATNFGVKGSNTTIKAGLGDQIRLNGGVGETVNGASETIVVAANVGATIVGFGDKVSATNGGASLTFAGGGTGAASSATYAGAGGHATFEAGSIVTATDDASGLAIVAASGSAKITIANFAADATGWIELLSGAASYASAAAAKSALTSDGHGGSKLLLASGGFIDFLGMASSAVASHKFVIG